MPAGDSAAGKARYRKRAQTAMAEAGQVVPLREVGPTITADRADYNTTARKTFSEVDSSGYIHIADFEAKVQSMVRNVITVLTVIVPRAYIESVIDAQDAEGSLFVRVYGPPKLEWLTDEEEETA